MINAVWLEIKQPKYSLKSQVANNKVAYASIVKIFDVDTEKIIFSSQKKNQTFSFPILDFSDIEKIYFKSTFIIFGKESHRAVTP